MVVKYMPNLNFVKWLKALSFKCFKVSSFKVLSHKHFKLVKLDAMSKAISLNWHCLQTIETQLFKLIV
jgi:hypothetical protein